MNTVAYKCVVYEKSCNMNYVNFYQRQIAIKNNQSRKFSKQCESAGLKNKHSNSCFISIEIFFLQMVRNSYLPHSRLSKYTRIWLAWSTFCFIIFVVCLEISSTELARNHFPSFVEANSAHVIYI